MKAVISFTFDELWVTSLCLDDCLKQGKDNPHFLTQKERRDVCAIKKSIDHALKRLQSA